jgi:hypothetical protein
VCSLVSPLFHCSSFDSLLLVCLIDSFLFPLFIVSPVVSCLSLSFSFVPLFIVCPHDSLFPRVSCFCLRVLVCFSCFLLPPYVSFVPCFSFVFLVSHLFPWFLICSLGFSFVLLVSHLVLLVSHLFSWFLICSLGFSFVLLVSHLFSWFLICSPCFSFVPWFFFCFPSFSFVPLVSYLFPLFFVRSLL